jgi:hypothetical protein
LKQWKSSEFGNSRAIKANLVSQVFEKGAFNRANFDKLVDTGASARKSETDKDVLAILG